MTARSLMSFNSYDVRAGIFLLSVCRTLLQLLIFNRDLLCLKALQGYSDFSLPNLVTTGLRVWQYLSRPA